MRRDADAFCEAHGDALRRLLAVALADVAAADRISERALAAAHRHWRRWQRHGDPLAEVQLDALRRARRAIETADRHHLDQIDAERDESALDDRLAGLRPTARAVLVYRVLADRTGAEIAAALGRSPASVTASLAEAYATVGIIAPGLDEEMLPYAPSGGQ